MCHVVHFLKISCAAVQFLKIRCAAVVRRRGFSNQNRCQTVAVQLQSPAPGATAQDDWASHPGGPGAPGATMLTLSPITGDKQVSQLSKPVLPVLTTKHISERLELNCKVNDSQRMFQKIGWTMQGTLSTILQEKSMQKQIYAANRSTKTQISSADTLSKR